MKATIFSSTLETKYIDTALWGKIESLNFQLIADRMIVKHGWTIERTTSAIDNYRRFLYLCKILGEPITPTTEVDAIWHEHILHTNKYVADYQRIFGDYLHHFPTPAKWQVEETNAITTFKHDFAACQPTPSDCSCSCNNNERTQNFDNPVYYTPQQKAVVYTKLKEEFFV